jgi:hypothetical protein
LGGSYVVRGVTEQDGCAVVEVKTVGLLGALAGDVDQVRAGVVVGAVGADTEVEIAVELEGAQLDL